jgi:Fe-S oxidoreductase
MCSGLGVCRKTLEGTMCPSYMATRDEAHSTRGRANVLRLTMAGRLGEAGLGDESVRQVLDLCLECRACRVECPVGVDVGRFKSEFLADYWRRHGTPVRARLLGHVHEVSRWASRLAPFVNPWLGLPIVRRLNEQLFGIDRRRPLPRWAGRTLASSWKTRPRVGEAPSVLLFCDTFTNYYHPGIGLAAADVLEAAGLAVDLAPNACCSRPLISQGLLAEARERALENTRRLHPAVAAGQTVVFLEPSCLSALREDVPALLSGDDQRRARQVADACVLFEELVERTIDVGQARLPLGSGPSHILLHGHCHQKSMGLLAPAKALLSRIPGATVTDLDAGCCGMAGSFGYAREHFDVSRAIGERRLLPAARALPPDGVLVASGVSCRQQVNDFAGVRALHPAELLRHLVARRDGE